MKVKITYYLNEKGRKKSLHSGGDGNAKQIIEADIKEELLDNAEVNFDNTATLEIGQYRKFSEPKIIGTYDFSNYLDNVSEVFFEEHKPHIKLENQVQTIEFDEPQTVESLLKFHKLKLTEIAKHNKKMLQQVQKLTKKELPKKIMLWEKAVEKAKNEIDRRNSEIKN